MKKFCIRFTVLVICLILASSALVFAVDPFYHYRANSDLTKIICQNPYYENTGIASHAVYDTLVTGTSMVQNFRANWFNDKFGCNAVRLAFDGGLPDDFNYLLDAAFKSSNNIETVYFGLDNYLLSQQSKLSNSDTSIPSYLVDGKWYTDVKYLLNKDILFGNIKTYYSYKFSSTYNVYDAHAWDMANHTFSKEAVLKNISIDQSEAVKPTREFEKQTLEMLDMLKPYITSHSSTQFVFFSPPYSILYWYSQIRTGSLDATLYSLNLAYKTLLKYSNVHAFYFQNEFDMITNLDKYKDFSHYHTDYNKYMLECFVNGKDKITTENIDSALSEMKEYACGYDYDSLLK